MESLDTRLLPHLPRLFRVAYRLTGNTADAQDLVQDTCVSACEHLNGPAEADAPLAWLLRVLQNRFIDGSRRGRRAPFVALNDAALAVASTAPGPAEMSQSEESCVLIERAFQSLEPMQRLLLGLRAEGYALDEIESISGVSREVLRARLHRARRSLAQRLDESGSAAPGAPSSRSTA